MQQKKVAAALFVKNEEALIERCLLSIKDKVDAIYILDTGSIDRTVEIARKYTPHTFVDFVWIDHMADAANHIKNKVPKEYEWILSIDGDEQLLSTGEEIQQAIALAKDVVRVEMIGEDGTNAFGFGRLFRNTPEIYWCKPIHKHLNVPGEGEHVGNVRIMYGHSPAHQLDPDRSLRILEKTVAENPASRELYYLGREYMYKGRFEDAITTFKRYFPVAHWEAEIADAYLLQAQAYAALRKVRECADSISRAIQLNPNFKEALEFMVEIEGDAAKREQWKRMARYASNEGVLWKRVEAKPPKENVIFFAPHNDDEALFGSYILMREKPLVIVVYDSAMQVLRGEIGCSAKERRKETLAAMALVGCPVLFMNIEDIEYNPNFIKEQMQRMEVDRVYAPAVQSGNVQHDLIGRLAKEVFGDKCKHYTTYTKTELYTTGDIEIKPTQEEMDLKEKMLSCYKSQLALPSTLPHFNAVVGKSEWLLN